MALPLTELPSCSLRLIFMVLPPEQTEGVKRLIVDQLKASGAAKLTSDVVLRLVEQPLPQEMKDRLFGVKGYGKVKTTKMPCKWNRANRYRPGLKQNASDRFFMPVGGFFLV